MPATRVPPVGGPARAGSARVGYWVQASGFCSLTDWKLTGSIEDSNTGFGIWWYRHIFDHKEERNAVPAPDWDLPLFPFFRWRLS